MKPKLIHQEAMEFSFKAKQALDAGEYSIALGFYRKAAGLESRVAEFYFNKPEFEPTRSVIIRSAAFLNLKAGQIEDAQKFIFFGLLNSTDINIKDQLNNALEISVSLRNLNEDSAGEEYNYLNILRQRSVHYVLEPSSLIFGHSVSLSMIKEFTESYLKSLKAYSVVKLKDILNAKENMEDSLAKEIDKIINPLVTNSGYGSFKFSIANDFLVREGEIDEISDLKSQVIVKYHNEIFINPLTEGDIEQIKEKYSEDDVNEIFRPLTKIKSTTSPFKIGYYDTENFQKRYLPKIVNRQRKELLTIKRMTPEDIGELESSIIHRRSSQSGKVTKTTIFKEQLKSYEADIEIDIIEPMNKAPIILTESISLNMSFDSGKGFTFLFDDFGIEFTDIIYIKALQGFHEAFYSKLISIVGKTEMSENEQQDLNTIKRLIGNIAAFRNEK